MKKNIALSAITVVVMMTSGYAGGDISPILEPVVPQEPMHKAVPVYVGAGLVWGKYDSACSHDCHYEDVTYGGLLRVGYEFNQYIGIEARLLATFWEADPLGGQELQHMGIFVKPMVPVDEDFNIYALLGYGWTKTTTGGNKNLATIDESGFSAGAGFEYDLSTKEEDRDPNVYYPNGFDGQADQEKGWGLFVDYQRLLIKSNVPDMDVVSAGVTYDF